MNTYIKSRTYFNEVDFRMLIFKIIRRFFIETYNINYVSKNVFLSQLNNFFLKYNKKFIVKNDVTNKVGNFEIKVDFILKYESSIILLKIHDNFCVSKRNENIEDILNDLSLLSINNGIILYKSTIIDKSYKLKVESYENIRNDKKFYYYLIY